MPEFYLRVEPALALRTVKTYREAMRVVRSLKNVRRPVMRAAFLGRRIKNTASMALYNKCYIWATDAQSMRGTDPIARIQFIHGDEMDGY